MVDTVVSGSGTPHGEYNTFEEQHIDGILNAHGVTIDANEKNDQSNVQTPGADSPNSYNEKASFVEEEVKKENRFGEGRIDDVNHEAEQNVDFSDNNIANGSGMNVGSLNVENVDVNKNSDGGLVQGLYDNAFVGSQEVIVDDIIQHVETEGQN